MKKKLFSVVYFALGVVALGILLVALSCSKDEDGPTGPGDTEKGSIIGNVTALDGSPLPGVSVSIDSFTAVTDADGDYSLNDIPVANEVVIDFEKTGYVTTHKISRILDDKTSLANAALSEIGAEQTVNSSSGGTVAADGAEVGIPADGLVDGEGTPFAGNATVKLTYFDPTGAEYFDVFPGEFRGIRQSDGTEVPFVSFGFIDVEITDGTDELQLATGATSTIKIPIPASLESSAPDTIPLWFFDKDSGKWLEESFAVKTSGSYIGEVAHFTSWNADAWFEDEISYLTGRVVDENGTPLYNAEVKSRGVDYTGSSTVNSAQDGSFTIQVKSNSSVKIWATYIIEFYIYISLPSIWTTPDSGLIIDVGDIEIQLDTTGSSVRDLNGVFFVDDNTGWTVGDFGTIQKTTDGAVSWNIQPAGLTRDLRDIVFIDSQNGWVVGDFGTILHTSNGGANWNIQPASTTRDLFGVDFIDNNGWVVGDLGTILHTTDGGNSWSTQPGATTRILRSVSFANAMNGWIVGGFGTIKHTTDGGENWETQAGSTTRDLFGVCFKGANGWAVGDYGTVLHTSDAGETWETQAAATTRIFRGVHFTDSQNGWVVGDFGTVRKTTNGGNSWSSQFVSITRDMFAVHFPGSQGWAVGDFGTVVELNGAEPYRWDIQNSGTDEILRGAYFEDNLTGWVVGDGGSVIHTTNGGLNWNAQNSGVSHRLEDICFIDSQTGWIVGNSGVILHTTNGGNYWGDQYPGDAWFRDISFIDADNGWVVGQNTAYDSVLILKTTDGGANWNLIYSDTLDILFGVFFTDADNGWVVGTSGTILRTTDGGGTWDTQASGTEEWLTDVYFIDASTGWVVGDYDYSADRANILHTTDGGDSWSYQNPGVSYLSLNSVHFIDSQNGWASGVSGKIIRTTDGGNNWHEQTSAAGSITAFNAVFFADSHRGWAVGWDGTIVYTATGGD